jgi:hypothetical protein
VPPIQRIFRLDTERFPDDLHEDLGGYIFSEDEKNGSELGSFINQDLRPDGDAGMLEF